MSNPHPSEILNKPSLTALSFALRHKELWPEGFGPWDYGGYSTCAMGLAARLWGMSQNIALAADALYISHDTAKGFFINACPGMKAREITPERVADLIDAHLAGRM